VLWASRLSFQKRPDILKEVASRLDAKDFQIDAYGREQDYRGSYLKGIAALQYKGTFHGISSLPLDQYDVFLYTSEVDGLPNVLLEMAAVGLPVVASDDGGVGEFIRNGETGILVPVDDIDGYVSAFQTLKANPETALQYAANAQELLRAQHSFEHFRASVGRDVA
jgi:glycosyltransferase involved in cell wall biosynthesis